MGGEVRERLGENVKSRPNERDIRAIKERKLLERHIDQE